MPKTDQIEELLLQTLEHERGGVQVYETALQCAVDERLREEWQGYLSETRNHVRVAEDLCRSLGVDTEAASPGREIVRQLGESLVSAMQRAQQEAEPEAAQLVACECVVLAETKDHLDWELLRHIADAEKGDEGKAVKKACGEVEDEEDEHLYHTKGWCRELWLASLGIDAVLPPPEEQKNVKTAIGAARAEHARDELK